MTHLTLAALIGLPALSIAFDLSLLAGLWNNLSVIVVALAN